MPTSPAAEPAASADGAPLSARSVILSTLLGTEPPAMSVRRLVRVAALFGVSEGTARTALSRMVQRGELVVPRDGHYALAGSMVVRQRRQDDSRAASVVEWNGRWRLAVVTADARTAADRAELRAAMGQLRMANQRDHLWLRPDNLDPARLPELARVVDGQCSWWSANPDGDEAELAASLWDLGGWSTTATELRRAMAGLTGRLDAGDTSVLAEGFVTSAAVLRHFLADPLLPVELTPRSWPGSRLRRDYDAYDEAFRRLLATWIAEA